MISFIVCVFNEVGNIGPTVATIRRAAEAVALTDYEVILVDDGSTDGSDKEIAELASQLDCVRAFANPANLGLGSSIRLGISKAVKPSFMMVPGDNDMSESMITLLLLCRNEADVILAVPFNREQRTIVRNIVSTLYQLIYLATFQIYAGYVTGPGIWPVALAQDFKLKSRRFGIMSELNVKMLCGGRTYAEIPGYVQAGPKRRSTVNLKNLAEVVLSYVRLIADIYFVDSERFKKRTTRVQIDFTRYMRGPNSTDSAL